MTTGAFGSAYRSRRAVAGTLLWNHRVMFLVILLAGSLYAWQVGAGISWSVLLEMLRTVPTLWLLLALLAYQLALVVGLEWEARGEPPTWTVTDQGLVRTRGLEVRTFPWSRFRSVRLRPGKDGHGDLWLLRRNLLALSPWIRVPEGRVWAPGNAFCIPDVERAAELEDVIRGRIR